MEIEPRRRSRNPGSRERHGAGRRPGSFDVIDPADGSVVRTAADRFPDRVGEIVGRVREAQPEWEAIGIAGRRRWLGRPSRLDP